MMSRLAFLVASCAPAQGLLLPGAAVHVATAPMLSRSVAVTMEAPEILPPMDVEYEYKERLKEMSRELELLYDTNAQLFEETEHLQRELAEERMHNERMHDELRAVEDHAAGLEDGCSVLWQDEQRHPFGAGGPWVEPPRGSKARGMPDRSAFEPEVVDAQWVAVDKSATSNDDFTLQDKINQALASAQMKREPRSVRG